MPIYRFEKLFNEECESNDENDSAREDQIPVAGIWNTSLCSMKDCLVALLFCGAQGVVAECTLWVNGIHEANFLTEMSACLHQLPERRNLRHINTVLLFQILFARFRAGLHKILSIVPNMSANVAVRRRLSWRQWRSEAKCRPGPTLKVPLFPPLKFAYKNLK